jgi:hypothetical protein
VFDQERPVSHTKQNSLDEVYSAIALPGKPVFN